MRRTTVPLAAALLALSCAGTAPVPSTGVEEYLELFFDTYPSRATAEGRHDHDDRLEDFAPERRRAWLRANETAARRLRTALGDPRLDSPARLDAELLLREVERQIFVFRTADRPRRDPLFWTEIPANAVIFLLVREDRPERERLLAAAARAEQIARLLDQAREALGAANPAEQSAELCGIAARQARAAARFYAEGFPRVAAGAAPEARAALESSGPRAAEALEAFAGFLDGLASRASGSPRLGALYAEAFRLATGVEEPTEQVLGQALEALADKRAEAADFGRSVWPELFPRDAPPADDRELLRALFRRVGDDHAAGTEAFVTSYRELVEASVDFVRRSELITLPDPLTLRTDRSPSYFVGQSVGGVYPAGPYAPEADTLWYLPTPGDEATPQEREAFFRDFNDHFNVMITPHEIVPGHYLQLKFAARLGRPVRALFADGIYVEGWGTFCERLMLDLGWGGPLDRLAHLKKQMENIARTIVDIRVHTAGATREEVLAFARDEALQEEQFAANLWTRSITSAPQLTYYWLGYREVWGLYRDARAAGADGFDLRAFMDGMMELGPVPLRHYRARLLGAPPSS